VQVRCRARSIPRIKLMESRVRRVKCDEGKPGCLRCQKFGRECDGYAEERSTAKVTSFIPIQPRPTALSINTPALLVPGNEPERHYFQIFCDEMAPNLPGYFTTEFWSCTVLQLSHSEPAIRHAVVALGALTKTLLDGELQSSSMGICNSLNSSSGALTEHHEFALSQYNKAIVNLRRTLAEDRPAIRTALIASLLFVCFENFHGDHEAAGQQVQCGLGLIDQWQAQMLPTGYERLPNQHHMDLLLNDEVFQMFARLVSQAVSHVGSEKSMCPNPKMLLWENIEPDNFEVPIIFSSVTEARNCFDYLVQRCASFHKVNAAYKYAPANGSWDGIPDWIGVERQVCILQLGAFEDALWALLNQRDNFPPEHGSTILYLYNKICSIYMYASIGTGECIYDEFEPDFENIVARAQHIIEESRQTTACHAAAFSFEAGVVPPLHLTALKCRNGRVRRQAIALLLLCPRREGCWDGRLLGKADAWLMALEEQGMDEYGFVPEQSRWRIAEIRSSLHHRWVYVRVCQDSFDEFGRWCHSTVTKETTITW
jgi:Fungal Zn(2)-Cys(6) binuclear cluster domain/Fungal specific transcription factor domain